MSPGLDDIEGRIAFVDLGGGERAVEQVEHPVEADGGTGQRGKIEVPHGPHPLASNVDTRDAGHNSGAHRPSEGADGVELVTGKPCSRGSGDVEQQRAGRGILAAVQLIRRGGGHEGLQIVARFGSPRVGELKLPICSPHGELIGEQIR